MCRKKSDFTVSAVNNQREEVSKPKWYIGLTSKWNNVSLLESLIQILSTQNFSYLLTIHTNKFCNIRTKQCTKPTGNKRKISIKSILLFKEKEEYNKLEVLLVAI